MLYDKHKENYMPKLTNDSLSLKVLPETRLVAIKDIIPNKNFQYDDFFLSKYQDYLLGKSRAYETRISIDKIIPGFYKRKGNSWKYIKNSQEKSSISVVMKQIRNGNRPALFLYHNLNQECKYQFVCSDDEITYYAYKELNMFSIPAMVLISKKELEESAFEYRMFYPKKDERVNCIFSVVPVNKKTTYSLLGEDMPESIPNGLIQLVSYINIAIEKLKNFHLNSGKEIHYHHIIYSILLRAKELIESIRLLISNNYYIQSACLVRNLYELMLNLYITWLSPCRITSIVQLTSNYSVSEWTELGNKLMTERISNGSQKEIAEKINKCHLYAYNLTNKVIEKARIHPFGEEFYTNIYSFLSKISHDDFSVSARYKNTLEFGDNQVYNEDIIKRVLHLADYCVANIYYPVMYDLGISN